MCNIHLLYNKQYFSDNDLRDKRSIMYQQEITRLGQYIDLEKGGCVLDVGCGTGNFLNLFHSNKWDKYGVEISEYAQKEAFDKDIAIFDFDNFLRFNTEGFFDLVIFRGTIQHLEYPMYAMKIAHHTLKKDGLICFLATPNSNSFMYKRCNDLPMIDEKYNFLIPSDKILRQTLSNFEFQDISFHYPYLGTPYANPLSDMMRAILMFFGLNKRANFAFFKNVLECYAYKK